MKHRQVRQRTICVVDRITIFLFRFPVRDARPNLLVKIAVLKIPIQIFSGTFSVGRVVTVAADGVYRHAVSARK